jgi:hypothetical protein
MIIQTFYSVGKPFLSSVKDSVVIILGHKLNGDFKPSKLLEQRIKTGLKVAKSNNCSKIILSGGKTSEGTNISEAQCMKDYIQCLEMHSNMNLILEEQSKNTIENAIYCKDIIESSSCKVVYLVTSDFHLPRSQCIFSRLTNKSISIIGIGSASGLLNYPSRLIKDRPKDIDKWYLSERIEIENNATLTMNTSFSKYNISNINSNNLSEVLNEIHSDKFFINCQKNNFL